MKKIYAFFGIILTITLFLTFNFVTNPNKVVATETTTVISETTTTVNDGSYYYYQDYQDLVSQVYDDVYDDVYDQVYAQIEADLNQEFYNQIYAQIETKFNELLSQDQIKLYVDDFQQDIHNVADLAKKSVFGVTSYLPNDQISIGSGVVYKYDPVHSLYYIVTNEHVVEDGTSYEIYLPNEETVDATLIGVNKNVDIAVLTFSSKGLSNIEVSPLGDSDSVSISDFVFAVGNPIGYNFYNSITMGIVSGLNREVDNNGSVRYIQHDAAINSGNSGGPIYNLSGEVIGINVSKFATVDIEGIGFAIPINLVKTIINSIETTYYNSSN